MKNYGMNVLMMQTVHGGRGHDWKQELYVHTLLQRLYG